MEVIPQNEPITEVQFTLEESLIKDVAIATNLIEKIVANEKHINQIHSDKSTPTNDTTIDVSRNVQPNDTKVTLPIIPPKNLPLDIRKELIKEATNADNIIEIVVDDEKHTNQIHSDQSSTTNNEEAKNTQPSPPITAVSNEIEKTLIKEVAIAADIIEEIVDDKKQTNQPHSDQSSTASKEEVKNTQPSPPITAISNEIEKNLIKEVAIAADIIEEIVDGEKQTNQPHSDQSSTASKEEVKNTQPSPPITAISNEIEKELIKEISTATAIIEKIISNKNYFNFLNEGNNIPIISTARKLESLDLFSKTTVISEEYVDIEKDLIKDIAVAVNIIDQIISKKINTSNPTLKETIISNKKIITKKVRKIISTAVVNPNLIALEKSIKELLSRKSIFTNFKA